MSEETKKTKLILEITDIDQVKIGVIKDLLTFLSIRGDEIYKLEEDDFWALIVCFIHAHYGINAAYGHEEELSIPLAAAVLGFAEFCGDLTTGKIKLPDFEEEGDPDDE